MFIPTISIVEIVYLTEKGKLELSALDRIIETVNLPNGAFSFREIDSAIALTVSEISRDLVPDMPDRIIAATALYLGLPLIAKDSNIRSVESIQTIW
ncbi:MAG: type II toxin-antitoxin system VapC family toxin [Blastocatellia bacterium]